MQEVINLYLRCIAVLLNLETTKPNPSPAAKLFQTYRNLSISESPSSGLPLSRSLFLFRPIRSQWPGWQPTLPLFRFPLLSFSLTLTQARRRRRPRDPFALFLCVGRFPGHEVIRHVVSRRLIVSPTRLSGLFQRELEDGFLEVSV